MKLAAVLCVPLALVLMSTNVATQGTDLLSAVAQKKMDDLVQLITLIEKGFVQLTLRNCTDVKNFLGYSYTQLSSSGLPDLSGITIDLHSGGNSQTFNFTTNIASRILASPLWTQGRPLVIFTPGFTATRNSPIVRTMASRLAATDQYNVLAVDPSSVLIWFYYYAAAAVRFIGEAFGRMLADFYNAEVTKFWAIGHSLGAHISGFAGKSFFNLTGVKLDRVTGLDPAGPCFFDESPSLKLNSTDASFVDVIHSDTGTFGVIEPCGHVDFYPNGGDSQPNCLALMCSHNKSWEFFSESITLTQNFPSVQCRDWYTFKTGACFPNPRLYMGFITPSTARGIYYLKTNPNSLYGMGEKGITSPQTVDLATSFLMWWNNFLGGLGF